MTRYGTSVFIVNEAFYLQCVLCLFVFCRFSFGFHLSFWVIGVHLQISTVSSTLFSIDLSQLIYPVTSCELITHIITVES